MAGDFISDPVVTRDIPAHVELTNLDHLDDLFSWADFIALDVPSFRIQELNKILLSTSSKDPAGGHASINTHQYAVCRYC